MLVNTNKRVKCPKINQVVFYQPPRRLKCRDYVPYPVIITDGCYTSNGKISNFWEWQRITLSGKFKDIGNGYGHFYIAEGYEVERKIIIKRNKS